MADGQVVINIDGVDNFAPVVQSVTQGLTALQGMAERTSLAFSSLFTTIGGDANAAGVGVKNMLAGITELGNDAGAVSEELKVLSTRLGAIATRAEAGGTAITELAAGLETLKAVGVAALGEELKVAAAGIRSMANAAIESVEPIVDLAAAVEMLQGALTAAATEIPLAAEAVATVGGGATASAAQITALGESIVALGATVTTLAAETGGVAAALTAMGAAATKATPPVQTLSKTVATTDGAMKGLLSSMAPLIAMFAAFKVVSFLVESESALEKLEARLGGVSKSSEEAHARLEQLQGMSERLGVPVEKLGDAYVKLRLAGINASEGLVTAVTNIAAVTGKSVDQVAKAISKASLDATRALKDFGISARNEGQEIVVSFHGQTERIGRDQQSIIDYMEKIGNHGYADQAKARANTLGGAFEGLKAKTFNMATYFMSETGLKGALLGSVKWMDELFDSMTKNSAGIVRWGTVFVDVLKIVGNAVGMLVKDVMDLMGIMANRLEAVFGGIRKLVTEGPAAAAKFYHSKDAGVGVNVMNLAQHTAEGLTGMGDAAQHMMDTITSDLPGTSRKRHAGDSLGGNTDTNGNPYGKPKKEKADHDPDKWMKDLHSPAMTAALKGLRADLDALDLTMLKVKVTAGGIFSPEMLKGFEDAAKHARTDFDTAVKAYETLPANATAEARGKALKMMEEKWAALGKAENAAMEAHYLGISTKVKTLGETFAVAMGLAGYKGALSFTEGFGKISAAVGASKAKLIADIEALAAQVTKAPTEAAKTELQNLLKLLKEVEGMEKTLAEESRRPTDNAIRAAGSRGPQDDNRSRVASAISAASSEAGTLTAKGSGANADEKARLEHLNTELEKLKREARDADKAFGSLGVSMKAKFSEAREQLVSMNDFLGTALIGTMDRFASATANAFGDMIRHSKTAGLEFSKAMKTALAATAKSFGDFFVGHAMSKFAEGLWPVNPAALAAGAGYMAAAGAMYALAGGGGNSAGSGGSGGSPQDIQQQRNSALDKGKLTIEVRGDNVVFGKGDPASIDAFSDLLQQATGRQTVVHFTS
jgi:hypothetical protein